jgi:hypothetical protein
MQKLLLLYRNKYEIILFTEMTKNSPLVIFFKSEVTRYGSD